MLGKTVSGIMLLLLLIGMLTLAFNIQSVKSEPKTWTVDDDGPADFYRIQEAINAASDGDTIFVRNGTYFPHIADGILTFDNICVNKSVSLIGENRDATIIDVQWWCTPVIKVEADNVTISGFTIRNSCYVFGYVGGGIELNSSYCYISNNIIVKSQYGVHLSGLSRNNVISNNIVTDNEVGIFVTRDSHNTLITGNSFNNTGYGIEIWVSSNVTIIGNLFSIHPESVEWALTIRMSLSTGLIYHNNFMNTSLAIYPSCNVTWDKNGEGNFWIDYNGMDADRDGIGDTPYIIDENNRDNYPLIYPYGYVPNPDLNGDGVVNIIDIAIVARAFGSKPRGPNWNALADLDKNGWINIIDIATVAKDYGKTV